MASKATFRDDEYITLRKTKVARLLFNLRSPTTERAAASRLGVGVHQYLDWEAGRAVPPHGKRGVLANCVYDWADERFKRSDFVRTWSALAGVWGWPGIAAAEWDYYDRAGKLVERPQLRDLLSDWNSVLETNTPRVRFVDGDHGSGKSTLVHSLLTQVVHGSSDVVVASASCPEPSQGHGYGPVKELVSEMVQQLVGPRMRERGLTLGDLLWKAPAWRDSILEGFEAAARPWAEKEKTSRSMIYPAKEIHPQFLDLIRMAKSPLLFFIDDLQWADPSTLSLLLSFIKATSSGKCPIYLVAAFRYFEALQTGSPDSPFRLFHRESLKEPYVRTLSLGNGIDVGEYLAKRYGGYELPTEVHRLAEVATRGNPYQLETLFDELDRLGRPQRLPQDQFPRLMEDWLNTLRRLLSGIDQESDQDAGLEDAFDELRGRIGDVILKLRLDRMDRASLKALLDQAAVEWSVGGKGFTVEVLRSAAPDAPYIYVDLADLEYNYLLVRARPHSPSEADQLTLYEFLYWLYGSYLYAKVPPASRPELHLRVAQCLEVLYAGSPTIAGVLAEHFARGGEPLRAAAYALEAARLEASQSAWATVEHWCRLGLKWLGTVEGSEAAQGRLNLAYELAQSYYRNGDYHSATETFQEAIDQAQLAEADPYMVARLWAYLSEGEEAQGDYPSARRALRQGQACVHKHHLPPSEVTLWLSTMEGLLLSRADKNERAVSVLQQVILDGESLPTRVFSDFVRMRTYNCLGIALSCQDRYDESTVAFQKGIEVATRLGDWSGLADLRSNLGEDFVYMGHFEEAGELMREAFDNAKKANDTDAIAWAGGILGNMYRESGHPNEAIACLEEATQLLEQTGANESEPSMYADLALSYLDLAKCDVALAIARHARQWARSRSARAYWLDALGQIEMGCSSSCEQASLHFEEAIQLFDQAGSRQFGARSRRNLAQLRAKTGQKGAAIKLAEDALVSFREKNLPFEVARTEKFLRELADQV